jgi:CubicO group peptidase (beta-lactamase class C family)
VPELDAACGRILRAAQSEHRLPSVTAAVWRRGGQLWAKAVGVADVERREEATPDHQHRIASITKTFAAVSVLQLRDAGALDLDDRVDRYVRGLTRAPTLRRLLSHAAGIQRENPGSDWEREGGLPGAAEVMERLADVEQVLPEGDEWHYSNLGFVLLGEVVERVAGVPYERYVEERLLAPLGLERTSWEQRGPASSGYFVQPYADRAELQPILGGAPASGGLWSTVGDLGRWGSFLCDPDPVVLSPETAAEMHRFQTMADLERWTLGWGLGLMLFRRGDRVFAGHSGGHAGFLSNVCWDQASGTVAAIVTNSGAGIPIESVSVDLLVAALDAAPPDPAPWRPGEPVPGGLEDVLGPWWSEGSQFEFRWREGRLECTLPGSSRSAPAVFERIGDDRYRTVSGRERGELLELVRDDGGRVVKLYWASYPFTREPHAF